MPLSKLLLMLAITVTRSERDTPAGRADVVPPKTLFAKVSGVIEFRDRGTKGKFVSIVPQELKKA